MLARRGLRILGRNVRIQGVEVDLIVYDPVRDELIVVEVKSTADGTNGLRRLGPKQRRRLARVVHALAPEGRVRATALAIRTPQPERYRALASRMRRFFIESMSSLIHRLRRESM